METVVQDTVTITRKELHWLCFRNSKNVPLFVNDDGVRYRWVGIGWVNEGSADGTEVKVVEK